MVTIPNKAWVHVVVVVALAVPLLVLVIFLGSICAVSLALGSERRKYALKWSAQVLSTVRAVCTANR